MAYEPQTVTVRHAVFTYQALDETTGQPGGVGIAFRNQEVVIPFEHDFNRGQRGEAFYVEDAEEEVAAGSEIPDFDAGMSDEEYRTWVHSATVQEIADVLSENPDQAQRVYDLEQERANPRRGVVEAVAKAKNSS